MSAQDWYDDTAYEDAVEHSKRVAQAGRTAILGVSGLLGVAAMAAAVIAWPPPPWICVVMTATRQDPAFVTDPGGEAWRALASTADASCGASREPAKGSPTTPDTASGSAQGRGGAVTDGGCPVVASRLCSC